MYIKEMGARPCNGCCLRRVAQNTDELRSRSDLCDRVIRREATETEGLVYTAWPKVLGQHKSQYRHNIRLVTYYRPFKLL